MLSGFPALSRLGIGGCAIAREAKHRACATVPETGVLMVVRVLLREEMKTMLSVLAVLAGTTTAGFAADLPSKAAPPAPAAFTWSGCFVGIEGGQSWGQSEQVATSTANAGSTITGKFNVSGGLAGGTAGCNL